MLLRLTKTGRRIVDEVTAQRRDDIATIAISMPANNQSGLARALRAFAAAGGEAPAEQMERDVLPFGWE